VTTTRMSTLLETIHGGLIVSCQPKAPLNRPDYVADLARAMVEEGACALRIEGAERIEAVRAAVDVPILGIIKRHVPGFECYITASAQDVEAAIDAGADVVALDGRDRARPDGSSLEDLVARCRTRGVGVMADVSTLAEGLYAARCRVDLVASTLSGYTPESRPGPRPDLELIAELATGTSTPVVAEGRLHSPTDVRAAFARGAHAVVVGSAITEPRFLIARFLTGLPQASSPDART
jgi:N-acylglucosamine-6-phosphate 2-epimerase